MSTPQSLKLKQIGNTYFHEHNYKQAIKYYTKAIQLDPTSSILFSNRARCFKLLENLFQANEDAQRALTIDPSNIKAQLLSGQILLDIAVNQKDTNKIKVAIQKLKKSLSMSFGIKNFEVSLQEKIFRAKKNLWEVNLQHQIDKKRVLKSYLMKLIQSDSQLPDNLKDTYEEKITEILNFNINTEKSKAPKDLVCDISKQIMKDPVCNEFGNTYCRKPYLQHVQKLKTDPKTKKSIMNVNYLIPNINIRKAINEFLQNNIWAYEEIITE